MRCEIRWIRRVCATGLMAVFAQASPVAGEEQPAPTAAVLNDGAASQREYSRAVVPFFAKHCNSCHGSKKPEKELELARLDPDMKASTSAARWAMVLKKLTAGEMPPKEEPRPAGEGLAAVTQWIQAEMKRAGKHVAFREAYANGNSLPHELLFGAKPSAPFDAPSRVRRLSPEIYSAFVREIAKDGPGIGQPFSPAGKNTFKDMGGPLVDEPITAQLIANSLALVEKQTAHKMEHGEVKGVGFVPKEFTRLFDEKQPASEAEMAAAVKLQFERVLRRPPTPEESVRFVALLQQNIAAAGRETGVKYGLAAVMLLPEAIFRVELGGATDAQGRARLSPREIAFALAYALTDRKPDSWLLLAAAEGQLNTREGVAGAARKMLADPKLEKPRLLRFFREYFGYDQATEVFKEDKEFSEHDARVLVEDTDRLVEYILERDQHVLRELLTTNKSFVAYKTAAESKKKRAEELAKFEEKKRQEPEKFKDKKPPKIGRSVYESYNLADFPDTQPVELPASERAGILTQPAWLVSRSKSDENHVILRGKWVRERLLGNVVPDIPITVDAQLPMAPEKTLRERMSVTQQEYCWQCHRLMNRVGYPFEMYDHFGRFRTVEPVLDLVATAQHVDAKGKNLGPVRRNVPANASGGLEFTGDPQLSGEVTGAVEFMQRLAKSERVEQVFVRHVFRYFNGRNETPGDAASLQEIHAAYKNHEGSMRELLVCLLSSDSFLYRAPGAGKALAETPGS